MSSTCINEECDYNIYNGTGCNKFEYFLHPEECSKFKKDECVWDYDEISEIYNTTCKHTHYSSLGEYCPFCGKVKRII